MSKGRDNSNGNGGDSNGQNESVGSSNNETSFEETPNTDNEMPFENPAQISTRMEEPIERKQNSSEKSSKDSD